MIMLKVLTQYQEATGDPRVIPVMEKYFAYQAHVLATEPLKEWAVYRWQDELASVLWLYNRDGDPQPAGTGAATRRGRASTGDDVRQLSRSPEKWRASRPKHDRHGVNNAMGLKTAALWHWFPTIAATGPRPTTCCACSTNIQGLPNGMFSADEHFAGRNPSQGTELCAVVEAMFSLELDLAVVGRPRARRPAGEDRLQCAARRTDGRSVGPPIRPAAEPGAVLAEPARLGAPTGRNRTSSGWSRTTVAAPPTCIKAGPNSRRRCGWPRRDDGLALAAYAPSQVQHQREGRRRHGG